MDEKQILELTRNYIETNMQDVDLENLEEKPVQEVFQASIDIVDFIMEMEEKFELEEEINLEKLGPRFADNITFAELATEVKKYLDELEQK